MFPSPFRYQRASSVEEAIRFLSDNDDAKLLAGGQSLLPLMKLRLSFPETIIDVSRLETLKYVRLDSGYLAIGALTRFCDLVRSHLVQRECPALAYVASLVGDPQVRHRGTIGGSLSHADPASDLPALLLTLEGSLVAVSVRGKRVIPAADFFRAFLTSALDEDEIVTEIRIPRGGRSFRYEKFTRRAQEWAIIGVATVRDELTGVTRIGLVNAGPTPLRATRVEAAVASGAPPATAAREVVRDMQPSADAVASIDYRRHLAVTLVERTLREIGAPA